VDLKNKICVPCEVGAPTATEEELKKYLPQVPDWKMYEHKTKIKREFEFEDFKRAVEFINKVADLAEHEGHHPDIYLYDFKKVRLTLWTHKIGGLHRNDFVLAAKIDQL
jgi:4a-hydroxytetrahydrobiopterin dehydratase